MSDWITHRQPTKKDGDKDGEVVVRHGGLACGATLELWRELLPGTQWRHSPIWQTPPQPEPAPGPKPEANAPDPDPVSEPEPEATAPAPKPELRVGQVWRSRLGEVVTIKSYYPDPYFPFHGTNNERYTFDGRFYYLGTDRRDLVELITDAPAEEPQPQSQSQPEPAPTTRKVPRLFAGPIRRSFAPSGRMVLDAIADDGTAWAIWIDSAIEASALRWHQIPPLPQPEAE